MIGHSRSGISTTEEKRMQLESHVLELLENIGVKQGQVVLDFGCGPGTYAIPAARIVGNQGKVYALDKDREALVDLMHQVEQAALRNVERMDTDGELRIDLPDNTVDTVFLFDVLHSYYLPLRDERRRLLEEVWRICRSGALILVYPKHMESTAKDEIEKTSFRFEREYSGTVIHENTNFEQGKILIFRKREGAH
jgi:ubiquinone/menaquinone biosynthesis C-methylase UbiE